VIPGSLDVLRTRTTLLECEIEVHARTEPASDRRSAVADEGGAASTFDER
jgi:hypothetical protein